MKGNTRRKLVKRRRVIFIGVEGKSDRAFARFLQFCCDEEGLHLHLDIKKGNGGDSVSVVKEAALHLKRRPGKEDIRHRLLLLDRDRYAEDLQAGRDAQAVASEAKLEIIFQDPNLEGLLLRLHPGHENRKIAAGDSMAKLHKVWPEYSKSSLTADQLKKQRFGVSDLRRAALHDQSLRRLLEVLGLLRGGAPARSHNRRR